MLNEIKRKCQEAIADSFIGNSYPYYCNCCGHSVKKFLPYGAKSDIYTRYHIIGGGGERRNVLSVALLTGGVGFSMSYRNIRQY